MCFWQGFVLPQTPAAGSASLKRCTRPVPSPALLWGTPGPAPACTHPAPAGFRPQFRARGRSQGSLSKGFGFSARPTRRVTEWFRLEGTFKALFDMEILFHVCSAPKSSDSGTLAQGFRKVKEKIFLWLCRRTHGPAASQQTLPVIEERTLPFDLF